MSRVLLFLLALGASIALTSCTLEGLGEETQEAGAVKSCYDTGHGIVCTKGTTLGARTSDADGDGEMDELVCGDADSDSDGDSESNSASGPDGEGDSAES